MTLTERLRAVGVSQERIAALQIKDSTPAIAEVVATAAKLADPQTQADLTLLSEYRASDAFRRVRLRSEHYEALNRAFKIEEMKND